jgi:hypothetical protein
VIDTLFHEEEEAMVKADEAQNAKRRYGLEAAMVIPETIFARAAASGRLYSNLFSESLQFDGARDNDFRSGLEILGSTILWRLRGGPGKFKSNESTAAIGGAIARAVYGLAAAELEPLGIEPLSRSKAIRALLAAVSKSLDDE